MRRTFLASAVALIAACSLAAYAGSVTFENDGLGRPGGEVNISGATLFRGFFTGNQATNDWMNVDWDQIQITPCDPNSPYLPFRGFNLDFCITERLDQLAPDWDPFSWTGYWLVHYRGVGSGNGLKEFVNYQLTRDDPNNVFLPTDPPGELGLINRFVWADGGAITGGCCITEYDPQYDPNCGDPNNPACYYNDPAFLKAPYCEVLTVAVCQALPTTDPLIYTAVSLGESTICEPDVCDPIAALGACFYPDPLDPNTILCTRTTENDCVNTLLGVWQGAGTLCSPPDQSGSPYARSTTDLGVMDVPTRWFVTNPDPNGFPSWELNPGEPGYGLYAGKSWDTGQSNKLKSLAYAPFGTMNTNTANPDENTVYDTAIAYVPISFIANPGTGLLDASGQPNITAEELRYLFLTGRMPDGKNLIVATRDSGSGTRNGGMNSIGVDPSHGRGDNLGTKTDDTRTDVLGPYFQATNKGGSSRMEGPVQNSRLAVGYTGLFGSSRAIEDATGNKYEILNIKLDGATAYVRPTVDAVLKNCNKNTGWQIGGPETFASRGNPFETDPGSPAWMYDPNDLYDPNDPNVPWPWPPFDIPLDYSDPFDPCDPWWDHLIPAPDPDPVHPGQSHAANYLRNIVLSIDMFGQAITNSTPGNEEWNNMPGQFLAENFFLFGGIECLPEDNFTGDPTVFEPNPNFNQAIQDYISSNQIWPTPDPNRPNRVPTRLDLTGAVNPPFAYEDGSVEGDYHNPFDAAGTYNISGGSTVPANWRNKIAGDFAFGDREVKADPNWSGLGDGVNDIYMMMLALADPIAYRDNPSSDSNSGDPAVPEILGDYNGDGNFNADDVRYFADGLLAESGAKQRLSRYNSFRIVDLAWFIITGDNNFFDTVAYDCNGNPLNNPANPTDPTWMMGWTAFDVAGNTPYPGATPHGWDGRIDCADLAYIENNRIGPDREGDWDDINEAVLMDLSCDMNADYLVNRADVLMAQAATRSWCGTDYRIFDMDCDGVTDFGDINPFVDAMLCVAEPDPEACYLALHPCCRYQNAATDGVSAPSFGDINPFVDCLVSGICP